MHTDFFAVPHLTLPVRRGPPPPLGRLLAFVAIITLCLTVDVLIVFALYKAGAALLAELNLQKLGWIALASTLLLYLIYRLSRPLRRRTPVEGGAEGEADSESVGS